MAGRKSVLLLGLMLGGCMQATLEPATQAGLTPRDRQLLAKAPYAGCDPASLSAPRRRLSPLGSAGLYRCRFRIPRYLYYVLPNRKAIRYGVTVGEDALAFWGVARVGRKEEWPAWVPTADIKRRIPEVPNRVEGGAHNPLGARGIYLYQGNRDTLFRIHGTNQPEYIGHAISSGCGIRMTNEDVIDLYNRVKMGAIVVVLAPGLGRPRMAMTSNPN